MRPPILLAAILGAPLLLAASPSPDADVPPPERTLVRAMQDEMARTHAELMLDDFTTPYYVSLTAYDVHTVRCSGKDGGLIDAKRTHQRFLRADVRVGSYDLDNSNSEFQSQFFSSAGVNSLPLTDDYHALRRTIWLTADPTYKDAVEALEKKRAIASSMSRDEDEEPVPSFNKREGLTYIGSAPDASLDDVDCAALVEAVSGAYGEHPDVVTGEADASARVVERYFIDTEGAFVYEPSSHAYIEAWGSAVADDGMSVAHLFDHVRRDFDSLPSLDSLVSEAAASAQLISELRAAPKAETYHGPVLVTGVAANQLMWSLLANSLSGTPSAASDFGVDGAYDPLRSRLDRRVFGEGVDLVDDPTRASLGDVPLMGSYAVDHEGVPAQKVELIADGMLRRLLMSRTPSKKFKQSTGHGRGGLQGVQGTPGNLILEAKRGLSLTKLERALIDKARRDGLDYAYIIEQFDNPWTTQDSLSTRSSGQPHGWGQMPGSVVVRLHVDGRREYVRGLSLTKPLIRDLQRIVAWGDEQVVTNFVVPSAPDLLHAIAIPAMIFDELDMPAAKGPFARPHDIEAP